MADFKMHTGRRPSDYLIWQISENNLYVISIKVVT